MKFEYYIRHGMENKNTIGGDLDYLGKAGWELVTVTGGGVSGAISRWIFKRQVIEIQWKPDFRDKEAETGYGIR